jgi:hypothetical protein
MIQRPMRRRRPQDSAITEAPMNPADLKRTSVAQAGSRQPHVIFTMTKAISYAGLVIIEQVPSGLLNSA